MLANGFCFGKLQEFDTNSTVRTWYIVLHTVLQYYNTFLFYYFVGKNKKDIKRKNTSSEMRTR